ncbi:MAG TPA: hypothetical protein ENJ55_00490 [Rhizobiales bacterium]|nr:hypothetical protein [Hyphomicrobiales bacterium]
MLRFVFALLAGVFVFIQSASADDFEAQIKQAVELSKAGQPVAALEAMDRATTALWLRSPFTVSKAFFVTKPATEYGVFEKRPDNVFINGSKLRVYTELIGYDWQKVGDQYQINIIADVALQDTKGKILWSKKEFGKFRPAKSEQFKKLYVNLSLSISGVPAGDYVIEYTLIDKLRKQVALIALPFKVKKAVQ